MYPIRIKLTGFIPRGYNSSFGKKIRKGCTIKLKSAVFLLQISWVSRLNDIQWSCYGGTIAKILIVKLRKYFPKNNWNYKGGITHKIMFKKNLSIRKIFSNTVLLKTSYRFFLTKNALFKIFVQQKKGPVQHSLLKVGPNQGKKTNLW